MLKLLKCIQDADMAQLAAVYEESNRNAGRKSCRSSDPNVQILTGENLFYEYILFFFDDANSVYAVWTEEDKYVSALRLEPFEDGLLLNGLETHPEYRRRGFAKRLIDAVVQYLASSGACNLYSHVDKSNIPSLALHESCGFVKVSDHAVYLDGSRHRDSYTMLLRVK